MRGIIPAGGGGAAAAHASTHGAAQSDAVTIAESQVSGLVSDLSAKMASPSLTTGALPKATAAATIGDSSLSENAGTLRSTKPLEVPLSGEILFNAYLDGSTYKRRATGVAARIRQGLSEDKVALVFDTVATGAADAAITWVERGTFSEVYDLSSGGFVVVSGVKVSGIQVVGAQQAAIAALVAPATATSSGYGFESDTEFDTWTAEIEGKITALLSALQSHGLLATPA